MNVGTGGAPSLPGGSITSSDAEPLSELRAQDTVSQLERGEGLGNEKVGLRKTLKLHSLQPPTVQFYIHTGSFQPI